MKKNLITLAVMAMVCHAAKAQLTPEGVMATLPDIPSAVQMVNISGEQYENMFRDFHAKLSAAQKQCQEMLDKTTASLAGKISSKAMQEKVAGTNVTAAQAGTMDKSELQALAKSAAAQRLSSLGVSSKDAKAAVNGAMSKEELANRMMAGRSGGLTMKDVEAMSNMSEAERIEFVQNSGLSGSTQAAASQNSKAQASNAALTSLMQKITSLNGRIADLTQKSISIRQEANLSGKQLYEKSYKSKIDQLQEEILEMTRKYGAGGEYDPEDEAQAKVLEPQVKVKNHQLESLEQEFRSKAIPVWRDAVIRSMDVFRVEVLPLGYELKEAYAQAYELTGSPEYMGGEQIPFSAALAYLDAASYIDQYEF